MFVADGLGADESVNISNEFGGRIDPQLFGKCMSLYLFCYGAVLCSSVFSIWLSAFRWNVFLSCELYVITAVFKAEHMWWLLQGPTCQGPTKMFFEIFSVSLACFIVNNVHHAFCVSRWYIPSICHLHLGLYALFLYGGMFERGPTNLKPPTPGPPHV